MQSDYVFGACVSKNKNKCSVIPRETIKKDKKQNGHVQQRIPMNNKQIIKWHFTITEWILARRLVEIYGLWEYRPWKWRNILRETSQETKNKYYCQKQNRPQFFTVYTLIDRRNDAIKCLELCSEITRLRLVVPPELWTFYYVISIVYKSLLKTESLDNAILAFWLA